MGKILLQSAGEFTIEALTRIYNQSRKDYMIAMPMTVARMRQYIDIYDVDLGRSVVAAKGDAVYGIGMLGVRERMSWITRLGVLPEGRRMGVGRKMVDYLLKQARELGQHSVKLEVIQGNVPAIRMFRSFGFQPGNELFVLDFDTMLSAPFQAETIKYLTYPEFLNFVGHDPFEQPWILQSASYKNAGDAKAMRLSVDQGTKGWIVFRKQPDRLSHIVFHTIDGNPERLAAAGLAAFCEKYPGMKKRVENISSKDPHLPMLLRSGFRLHFKRTEMMKTLIQA